MRIGNTCACKVSKQALRNKLLDLFTYRQTIKYWSVASYYTNSKSRSFCEVPFKLYDLCFSPHGSSNLLSHCVDNMKGMSLASSFKLAPKSKPTSCFASKLPPGRLTIFSSFYFATFIKERSSACDGLVISYFSLSPGLLKLSHYQED